MKPVLHTQRLKLIPVQPTDLAVLHGILTNRFVRKFLFDDTILSESQIQDFIAISEHTFCQEQYGLWLLREKKSGSTAGIAGLWDFLDEPQPQLLYALLPDFTHHGLATEAANAVMNYSFYELAFRYLTASCDLFNVASQRVAGRLGMRKYKEEMLDGNPLVFFRKEHFI